MKYMLAMLLLFSIGASAQIQLDSIIVKQRFKLNGYRVTGISNDTASSSQDSSKLITKAAARAMSGRGGGLQDLQSVTNIGNTTIKAIKIGTKQGFDTSLRGINLVPNIISGGDTIQSLSLFGTNSSGFPFSYSIIEPDHLVTQYIAPDYTTYNGLYSSRAIRFLENNTKINEIRPYLQTAANGTYYSYLPLSTGKFFITSINNSPADSAGNISVSGTSLVGITNTDGDLTASNWSIAADGHLDIAEAIDLCPSGRADFAAGKTRFDADGGGYLANRAIYWDSYGNLSNDNNGAWSIGHEGAASFRSISNAFTDEYNQLLQYGLSGQNVSGVLNNNEGNITRWGFGVDGLYFTNSEDGEDTYTSNWGIGTSGAATLSSASVGGLTTSRGISINNASDIEVAYISNVGQIAFDNYEIYSDGEGLLTALSFRGGSVNFDGGGFTSDGDGNVTCNTITFTGYQGTTGLYTFLAPDDTTGTMDIRNGIIYDIY